MRKTLLTLNSRNILVMLRLMKEHRTRLVIHAILNFKIAATKVTKVPKATKVPKVLKVLKVP